MSDSDRTYTEAEHLALLTDAVRRETAEQTSKQEQLQTEKDSLAQRVDVLEAEKAKAETERDKLQADFDEFKAAAERAEEIAKAKDERVAKVKAANDQLPDSYFTEERISRWAEMTEDAFAEVVEALGATSGSPLKETAAFSGGGTATSRKESVTTGSLFAARRNGVKEGSK